MIIELNESHVNDIRRIVYSNKKYQGTIDFSFTERIANFHINNLLHDPNSTIFGYLNKDDIVIAFIDTISWPDKKNFTLATSSADQNYEQVKSPDSRWPHSIIALVNYTVQFYIDKGYTTGWTIRPSNPKWVPYTDAKECILRNYKMEIVYTVPKGEWPPEEYRLIQPKPLPLEENIVKIMLT